MTGDDSLWPYEGANGIGTTIVSTTYRTIDVGALERRIAELEAENSALRAEMVNLRSIQKANQIFATPQGCICPADAQMNCHNSACPRKPWTVTTSGSVVEFQQHHPRYDDAYFEFVEWLNEQ